jgi:DNA-binding transcriptional regulator YdaS (Cro superfamily)
MTANIPPTHAQLVLALAMAIDRAGSQKAVAKEVGLKPSEFSNLINGRKLVTIRQAKLLEKAFHISGQELWTEGAIAKGMREFAKVRAAK